MKNKDTETLSEGVVKQTPMTVTGSFDPIKKQTEIVLKMIKEYLMNQTEMKEVFIIHLKESKEEDLEYLKNEEMELFEIRYLTEMISNLERYMKVE